MSDLVDRPGSTGGLRDVVLATLPGVVLLAVAAELAVGANTERFGRIAVAVLLVAGVTAVARRRKAWPWALAAVVVAAAVLPGTASEVGWSLLAVAVTAAVVAALWRPHVEAGHDDPPTGGSRVAIQEAPRWCPPVRFGPGRWPRWIGDWAVPVLAWLAMTLMVNLSLSISAARAGTPVARVVWDAANFLTIARDGYLSDPRLAASFPGYPMLIRAANEWFGVDHELAAILLSNLAGASAVVLFWRWAGGWLAPRARLVALGLLVAYPYAFMLYGVAYADGLLLAVVLGALLAVERDRFVLAGLLGAAATFTRPNGLVIIPTLLVLVVERTGALELGGLGRPGARLVDRVRSVRLRPDRLRPRQSAVLLSAAGIGLLMVWMWRLFDDPLYFWSVQVSDYGHRAFSDPATWLKIEFINRPGEFVYNVPDALNQAVSAVIVALSLLSLPTVGRRLGWGYSVLGLSCVAILWVTATGFSPAGRYLLPFVPVLMVLVAEPLARRPRVAAGGVVVGAAWSCALAAGFAAEARFNW